LFVLKFQKKNDELVSSENDPTHEQRDIQMSAQSATCCRRLQAPHFSAAVPNERKLRVNLIYKIPPPLEPTAPLAF
jgi:hypothetical protein